MGKVKNILDYFKEKPHISERTSCEFFEELYQVFKKRLIQEIEIEISEQYNHFPNEIILRKTHAKGYVSIKK
ncbi:MAG: hypothetical protein CMB80_00370 [Flammeovirgaceae bacterium]|nr:hypothetical protein [Flammeovirgaceae bacterium]